MCAMSLSPRVLSSGSQENSSGWETLTLVGCPQLILCLCRFLDLHGILQAGGLGGSSLGRGVLPLPFLQEGYGCFPLPPEMSQGSVF